MECDLRLGAFIARTHLVDHKATGLPGVTIRDIKHKHRHHSQGTKRRPLLPSNHPLPLPSASLHLVLCPVPLRSMQTRRWTHWICIVEDVLSPTRGLRYGTKVGPPQKSCIPARRRSRKWANYILRLAGYVSYYYA